LGTFTRRTAASAQPTLRFTLVPPIEQPLSVSVADRDFVISRDGTRVVYVSGSDGELMVRAIDRIDPVRLGNVTGARNPFLSPDGRWVGFFIGVSTTELKISGGPAISLCRARGGARGATWGPDDTIVFSTIVGTLLRVPASGGEPTVLSAPDSARGEVGYLFPSFLPGGRAIVFTATTAGDPLANGQIVGLDLTTGQRKGILNGGSQPEYVEPGYLVYAGNGALRVVRFNTTSLDATGDPVSVVDHVASMATSGAAEFSVSASGTLVYLPGGLVGSARSLVWVDRQGREEPIGAPPRAYTYARISPDGTRAALEIRDRDQDLWIWDFARQVLTRLTADPSLDGGAVWTADGRRIIFQSGRSQRRGNLFWQHTDGTGDAEQLSNFAEPTTALSMLPDGMHVLARNGGRLVLVKVTATGGSTDGVAREMEPLGGKPLEAVRASLSADGRWITYESAGDPPQVYVRPFPGVDNGSWQISTDGGSQPVWARRGDELFYRDAKGAIVGLNVRTSPTFSAETPKTLLSARYLIAGTGGWNYDVAPDGRFLMIKDAETERASSNLVIVWNWGEELQRLVPR
jgi:Tol biopolymer transport system component